MNSSIKLQGRAARFAAFTNAVVVLHSSRTLKCLIWKLAMILLEKTVFWEGALESMQSGGKRESVPTITSTPRKTALEGADLLCSSMTAASGVGDVGLTEINLIKPWLPLGVCHHNAHIFTHCNPSIYVFLRNLLWVALALGATKRFEVSWESCIRNQSGMISLLTWQLPPERPSKQAI